MALAGGREVACRCRSRPLRLQTVAAAEVAQVVADVAEREPGGRRIQVAGPQMMTAA